MTFAKDHYPVISGSEDDWTVFCTCNWYGGRHETEQDALDLFEDHVAGLYE